MSTEEWLFDEERHLPCRLLQRVEIWGRVAARVWYPDTQQVLLVSPEVLKPAESLRITNTEISYLTAAARVRESVHENVLLAPIESAVIPLPHQIVTLLKAVSSDRIRLLLADEVGLGKTIEAGLIIKELKLRGLIRRILVVAPKGLVAQWVAEMRTHFNEAFKLLIPSDFAAFRRVADVDNIWKLFDQVVCPLDAVKPIDSRKGWSKEQVHEHNRDRFDDLIAADWDLIIVDEAHRLGGVTDQVARFRLGSGLADAAPYFLLLSATPHQGKTDAFHRLVSLLDKEAFPDPDSVTRERLAPYLARTEKRHAIDAQGNPLFKPRRTQLVPVSWTERHVLQRRLYESVSEYVRVGYNQALREKKTYVGFLLLLMQRLVTSSTRAIRVTLERRLDVLNTPEEQLPLFPPGFEDDWADLDGQEQVDTLLQLRTRALRNEKAEVQILLDMAIRAESAADAKAEALLELMYQLQKEESDPGLKILVFTEFVPTQQMLSQFLADRGFSVTLLNGNMDTSQRRDTLLAFANDVRVLISTDAGGEGLNLQVCHAVVNFDIPWNPMRLEQRIGRVDRIGQSHAVRAVNFVLAETVEYRVREVLEEKLAVILREFGVDKTGDVLDSADAGEIFDELYRDAILDPKAVSARVDSALAKIRLQAESMQNCTSLLAQSVALNPSDAQRLLGHPLPYWVERMTVNFLRSIEGQATQAKSGWCLRWPNGYCIPSAVFTLAEAEKHPAATYLTLEEPRVREIAQHLPRFLPGQPIPCLELMGIPREIRGTWSLWTVSTCNLNLERHRVLALFLQEDGRRLQPTARHIWDVLLDTCPVPDRFLTATESAAFYSDVCAAAEQHGHPVYEEMIRFHEKRFKTEIENKHRSFDAKRRAIDKIGLAAVREHRLDELEKEKSGWKRDFEARSRVLPDLMPLIMLRIEGVGPNV